MFTLLIPYVGAMQFASLHSALRAAAGRGEASFVVLDESGEVVAGASCARRPCELALAA